MLDFGDSLYRSVHHAHEFIEYTELPLAISISIPPNNQYLTCQFGTQLSGLMHPAHSTEFAFSFPDAIAAGTRNSLGCLVTISQTTVAVFLRGQSYFLFDSHSRNSYGMVHHNGWWFGLVVTRWLRST